MNPLVTVIIPYFNQADYISEALESVFNQIYDSIEVIIVNDGSTDPISVSALDKIAGKNLRVFHIKNQGVSHARNFGISKASGDYILPLDADDKIHPTYISKAVEILKNNAEVHVVYCRAAFFGARSGEWNLGPFDKKKMLLDNMVFNCALFRKRDLAKTGYYNSNMVAGWEDWDFWLSFVENNMNFYAIPEVLFYYRIKKKSRNSGLSIATKKKLYLQLYRNHPILFGDNFETLLSELIESRERFRMLKNMAPARWFLAIRSYFSKAPFFR